VFRRRARRPASFADADADLLGVLGDLEGAVNYTAWILDEFGPLLRGEILEVGAGQGTYTQRLATRGPVTAVEPSAAQCDLLSARLGPDDRVTVICGDLTALDGHTEMFDTAVLTNVLEHIADDGQALDQLYRLLRPGGALCVWVPAFEFLYGPFDREIGHHRRYRKQALRRLAESHGFEVTQVTYANLPGWMAWLLIVRLLRRRPTAGSLASTYDTRVVPTVRRIESRRRPPFGQSILLTAIKR
jgi:SAM-dependent methyltransferase